MRRGFFLVAILGLVTTVTAGPAAAVPPENACKLMTKAEVRELLLGKRIAKVTPLRDEETDAAQCKWETRYYQTPRFKKLKAAFALKLDTQSTESAADALEELRSAANDLDSSVDTVTGIGDEAFEHFSDLVVVSGDTVFQVGLTNFDESGKPDFDAGEIARDAAEIVLSRLDS
jgi:hypothetical protein